MSTDLDRRYGEAPVDDYRGRDADSIVALDFAEETVREAQGGRRRAWIVTIILIVICAAQAAAIAIMLPLKEVVPYTILVDRQTGYMETVRGVETGALKDDQAVVSSFLAQYVLQRETFDPSDFAERYKRVALWSADQARTDYVEGYRAGAPGNVLADLRPGSIISTTVKNIEILSPNTARIRFELLRRDPGFVPLPTDWQALVSFRFTGAPMRMEDRLINPLGFQVTAYRKDAEYAAPAAPPETLQAAPAVQPPPAQSPPAVPAPVSAPTTPSVAMKNISPTPPTPSSPRPTPPAPAREESGPVP